MSQQPDQQHGNQGGSTDHQQQPPADGGQQPQGGQQGGQPPGGQPPGGGRPPAGGAQGGGPGIGDIFNMDETKDELKSGVALFAAVGVGLGLTMLLGDIFEDVQIIGIESGVMLAPLLAALVALHQVKPLAHLEDNLVYGTAAITTAIGAIVLGLLTWLFGEIAFDLTPDIGDLFLIWVGAAIGSAVAAVIVVAVDRKL